MTASAGAPGGAAAVTFTKATDEELGPYPVASLDASLRKAVLDLFERLPGGSAK